MDWLMVTPCYHQVMIVVHQQYSYLMISISITAQPAELYMYVIYIRLLCTYLTRFTKTCIVNTSKFSTLVTHKISLEWQVNVKLEWIIELLFFITPKVSNLIAISCGSYGSPNVQNQMCELCTSSQIQSHISTQVRSMYTKLVKRIYT